MNKPIIHTGQCLFRPLFYEIASFKNMIMLQRILIDEAMGAFRDKINDEKVSIDRTLIFSDIHGI